MRGETRAEIDSFLDRVLGLQALGLDMDSILQAVSNAIPDEEVELIARLKLMSGGHEGEGSGNPRQVPGAQERGSGC